MMNNEIRNENSKISLILRYEIDEDSNGPQVLF